MSKLELSLHTKVKKAINDNPYLNRRALVFEMHEGRVTLRGVVGSYFQKQMAQESLRTLEEVSEICNELEVAPQA